MPRNPWYTATLGGMASYLEGATLLSTGFSIALFSSAFHYLAVPGHAGLPGPTDAWITLAATSRIRLGTLMTAATFRLPGPLAITVAQVDQMSGGRIELGIGTGWREDEHVAYGIPFPPDRFARLEEQLAIITGLWSTPLSETFTFGGEHYQLKDSPALPKPGPGHHRRRLPVPHPAVGSALRGRI
jgi:alkanesulfonate monooxygenase SsuD/methylene tetrahydromethanopterin reductase-like flavin-dependent oxidoreductase (luciferase family)